MSTPLLAAVVVALGAIGWLLGSWRSKASVGGKVSTLHSRPGYYGAYVLCWTILPAFFLIVLWSAISPMVVSNMVSSRLPQNVQDGVTQARSLTTSAINTIERGLATLSAEDLEKAAQPNTDVKALLLSKGAPLAINPEPYAVNAALFQLQAKRSSQLLLTISAIGLALLCLGFALFQVGPKLRSRNAVERVALAGLFACSMVAILTTLGIVLSMLFESIHFFGIVPIQDFLFGTVWDPRFSAAGSSGEAGGQFGLLPLLWGTLYISFVALLVAVPVGLFSAVYMSEYASGSVRLMTKPLLEILAGIPTIVYGFFALITFGPLLRDLGAHVGLSISATSVLTAGLIMGVMLIPFVSSLSDDIINAVPQSLREGSYGLGATQSETIKRVILPAALPGIVGAILLAASRAIGETMIVVLAAGIAPNLTLNPFEPVTTITVKIVSQLTGDLEFNSPQTLVAFALGLTLFVFTLALNIYALYIVRKYREQYE
ncbi:MAG: phosphate ABC transporter permease subunit PstC [Hyphomicrobium sp.]|uniref:phosphate ABC transporter permease subunit PstC n=1 Tax=Hyphomicrobium sp. TaxID=82 RepID=UPI0025BEB449|nr:phosphate ABC transporter permease subunit PstC [Hyphomicrobium sp.]MBX9863788.1 phosphate ABC transporter permease subunit PstC [Hyphomicrobium sp.]